MRINIALGATRDWFKYSAVTVYSILKNANSNDEYHFYILSNGFNDEEKELFLKLKTLRQAEFYFIEIDDSYFDGAIHDWLGVSSSYRLRLPSLVNESKILYIDSDIVAMSDIAKLYEHDVSEYYLAAVEDKMSKFMKRRVNLEDEYSFYNGGMQLMNLDKLREDNIEPTIMEKLRASTFYTDQDVINDVCRGKILELPLKYNVMPCPNHYKNREDIYNEAIENPVLVHFTQKPWRRNDVLLAEFWLKYNQEYSEL